MLERIDLRFFKCFHDLALPLSRLTLLSGVNSSGKSSILQSLALLHQTMREHEWSGGLMLNGSSLKAGCVADVVDQVHGRRSFGVALVWNGREFGWEFGGERNEMSMKVEQVVIDECVVKEPSSLQHLLPLDHHEDGAELVRFVRNLTYLTAERIGPRDVHPLDDKQNAMVVGKCGEDAASLLYSGRDEQALDEVRVEGTPPTRLPQAEAWMRRFFPGFYLTLEPLPRINAVFLGFKTSDDTDFHRPMHVGFGLTQVFPIIVAGVSAAKGDLIMIENPEVHLHPSGQALMGEFIAILAGAGVQVIVETHSDHVFNGIRRAVKAGRLPSEDAAFYFFRQRREGEGQVVSTGLRSDGSVVDWPDGFFDQIDKDTSHLLGWDE